MQSYQVPQFLDSGNKILGPLTVYQLLYALVGAAISFVIFTIVSNAMPGLGIFSLIPAAPVAAMAAYLAIGKYNGRDSDVYVLKFILHLTKPRKTMYVRKPDLRDLDAKLSELTPDKIMSDWRQRKAKEEEDPFSKKDTEYKISTIRDLGNSIESLQQNLLYETYVMDKRRESTEAMMSQLQDARGTGRQVVQKPVYEEDEKFNRINRSQQDNLNFFSLSQSEGESGQGSDVNLGLRPFEASHQLGGQSRDRPRSSQVPYYNNNSRGGR